MDGVDFFANFNFLIFFFHILSIFYANLPCDPIFENEFKIQIVWSMFEGNMTKDINITEILRQSRQQILAT